MAGPQEARDLLGRPFDFFFELFNSLFFSFGESGFFAGFVYDFFNFFAVNGLFDQTPDRRPIFVMLRAAKNGNALQGQLGKGLEHDLCCLLQYADFATLLTKIAKLLRGAASWESKG